MLAQIAASCPAQLGTREASEIRPLRDHLGGVMAASVGINQCVHRPRLTAGDGVAHGRHGVGSEAAWVSAINTSGVGACINGWEHRDHSGVARRGTHSETLVDRSEWRLARGTPTSEPWMVELRSLTR
jgi:hypothetical protein